MNRTGHSTPEEAQHPAGRARSEGEQRFRSIFEGVAVGIVEVDEQDRFVAVNGRFCAMLGYSREELLGKRPHDLTAPEDLATTTELNAKGHSGELSRFEYEKRYVRKDGSRVWVHVTVSVVRDEAGRFLRAIGTAEDVTDRKRAEDALRESEERFRSVLEKMSEGVMLFDGDGNLAYQNPASLRIHGFGRGADARIRRDDLPQTWNAWDEGGRAIGFDEWPVSRVFRGERFQDQVLRVERVETGHVFHGSYNGAPIRFGPDGKVVAGFITIRDITEQVRAGAERTEALEAVRASEAKFRSVFEQAAIGMGRVRFEDARWIDVNDAFCGMVGRTREEMLRTPWPEMTHPEDVDVDLVPFREMAAGTLDSYTVEKRFLHAGGGVVWAKLTLSLVRDASGRPDYEIAIIEDIGDRKRAEDALRAREAQFEILIQELHAGVALIDARGRFTLYNRRFLDLFGLSRDADVANVNSQDWSAWQVFDEDGQLLHVDDHPVRRVALTRRPVRGQLVGVRLPAGGEPRWMMVSAEPVLSAGGAVEHIICTYHDVTDLRRAEAALRDANERLRDADRRKDEFLGMLSHELRNPLAPIRNALYILDHARPEGQQARRAKDIVTRQVAHLTRLVDDLLDVTRIARGKIQLRHEELDLAALARRTAEDYRPLMQDRGLELEAQVPRGAVVVNGDPARLTQILGNLLSNAAKFTPAGGQVTLAMGVEGGRAVVHVRDTGPGIAPDVLSTLFDPFTQGKQTLARSEGGLGLGLSLVKGLVALHGGDVTVASGGSGRGADFIVTLPLASTHPGEEVAAARDVRKGSAAARRRVLVVEDNRDAADTLAELVEMLGHTAVVAYDAFAGLERASEDLPEVVLCDVGLPGMDGYEFARQLRALAGGRDVRLVALSGYAQPEDVARAVGAGFDVHVPKPPDPEQLTQILG